jgi:hypothetical protein
VLVVLLIGVGIEGPSASGPMKTFSEEPHMEHPEPPISVVRQKVLAAFRAMGAADGGCSETILIKDRHVVGRRFRQGGFEAVWVAGEHSISIFNKAGDLIEMQSLDDAVVQLKKAA